MAVMTRRRFLSTSSYGLITLCTFLVLTQEHVSSQATKDEQAGTVLLADGTQVHLVLMDDLQGKKLEVKQTVHFLVREDLVVDSKLIVKTGTVAIGHIESVSKSGLLGKSGRLVLQFDHVNAVSGTEIQLRGGAGVSGGKGGALTAISATWFGPDASLPVGTKINAYVNKDQRIVVP